MRCIVQQEKCYGELAGQGLTLNVLSQKADWWSEGLGFNLCVMPFSNVCISNFELEGIQSEWPELVGGWLGW